MTKTDFLKRTFSFSADAVRLSEKLPRTESGRVLARQFLRSATSIGANARAAQRARSRSEFIAKLGIVEEESDETLFWIDLIIELGMAEKQSFEALRREASEIISIVVSSIKTARKNLSK